MFKKFLTTRSLCMSAMIAALYAALTLLLAPISYGALQCRISEAMTLLPMLLPQAVPGLAVGCLVSNLLSPVAIWDVLFGTAATLLAAIGTRHFRNQPVLAALCPILSNGVIVGGTLAVFYGLPLWLTMLEVAAGEAIATALGFELIRALRRVRLDKYQ